LITTSCKYVIIYSNAVTYKLPLTCYNYLQLRYSLSLIIIIIIIIIKDKAENAILKTYTADKMLFAKKAKKLCNMLLTIYFVFLMSLKGSDCGANVHKVEYAQNVQWIKKKACENNALGNSHFFGKSTF